MLLFFFFVQTIELSLWLLPAQLDSKVTVCDCIAGIPFFADKLAYRNGRNGVQHGNFDAFRVCLKQLLSCLPFRITW